MYGQVIVRDLWGFPGFDIEEYGVLFIFWTRREFEREQVAFLFKVGRRHSRNSIQNRPNKIT